MLTINISSLKNQLSAILKKVRRGEQVIVMDRNQAVARLVACSREALHHETPSLLQDLEKRGIVTSPSKEKLSRKQLVSRLAKIKGASAVEMLLKEREESA